MYRQYSLDSPNDLLEIASSVKNKQLYFLTKKTVKNTFGNQLYLPGFQLYLHRYHLIAGNILQSLAINSWIYSCKNPGNPCKKYVNTDWRIRQSDVEGLKCKIPPEIIGVTVAIVATIVLLLSIVYEVRRRCYKIRSQRSPLDGDANKSEGRTLLAHKHTTSPHNFTSTFPDIPIIQRGSLIFLNAIGEGYFGKVYKGNGDSKEIVAIKMLKNNVTAVTEQDFMREVDTVSTFNHANILSLKGMVLRDATNNPWMVFEYMPYGDLAEVLRANSTKIRIPGSEATMNRDTVLEPVIN